MKHKEYLAEILRTVTLPMTVPEIMLGVCGEAYELLCETGFTSGDNESMVIEEAGDLLWYVTYLEYALSISSTPTKPEKKIKATSITGVACSLAEHIKKYYVRQKTTEENKSKILNCIATLKWWVEVETGLTISGLAEENSKKLEKRYPIEDFPHR